MRSLTDMIPMAAMEEAMPKNPGEELLHISKPSRALPKRINPQQPQLPLSKHPLQLGNSHTRTANPSIQTVNPSIRTVNHRIKMVNHSIRPPRSLTPHLMISTYNNRPDRFRLRLLVQVQPRSRQQHRPRRRRKRTLWTKVCFAAHFFKRF